VTGSIVGSSTTVNSGGVLAGSGTTGPVTVNSGGSLVADNPTFVTGDLSLLGSGQFSLQLNSDTATSGKVTVSALTLDPANTATLTLSNIGSVPFVNGETFTLIDYGDGAWNGKLFSVGGNPIADDGTLSFGGTQFRLSYNGLDGATSEVTLAVVPEPASALFLLGGAGAMMGLRRRRRS